MNTVTKKMNPLPIWLKTWLMLAIALLFVMCFRQSAMAMDVPNGSFTPEKDSGDNPYFTYTFTGDESQTYGFYANVESYLSEAIVNGTLTIPDKVTYVSPSGESVTVNVCGILKGAFKGCNSMQKLVMPSTIAYIGQEAFANCTNLTNVYVDKDDPNYEGYLVAEEIGYRAFYGCTQLKSVRLGQKDESGVKRVQPEAFMNCSSLSSVEIGRTVNWIDSGAFANCVSLDGKNGGFKVSDSENFFVQDGILYYRENENSVILLQCGAGTNLGDLTDFPEHVTQIRREAFYGCTMLSSIVIPDGVTSIGDQAFYGCTSLKKVTVPDSVTTIGSQAFGNCPSDMELLCSSGSAADNYAKNNNLTRKVTCTVTFVNTFTNAKVVQTVQNGDKAIPPTNWERDGYILRWSDNYTADTVIESSRTISTVWKKLYTVTFKDPSTNRQSVVGYVEEGTEATPPGWTREGYDLTWSSDAYKYVNADMTINAVWLISITQRTSTGVKYKKGDQVEINNLRYTITSYKGKRVKVLGLVDENVSRLVIPANIKFGGRTYKVTSIAASAFRENERITRVNIGKNLRSIENRAFYKCNHLRTLVIKSKVLINVSNYAFKGTKSNMNVYVPSSSLVSTYRAMLRDASLNAKAKVRKL